MKGLFPEKYGLTGHELAAAAMVKFYINEVGAKDELKAIMGSEVDGAALADLIDRAAAYCVERTKGSDVAALMQKVSGRVIVQNIGVEMLEFLTECYKKWKPLVFKKFTGDRLIIGWEYGNMEIQ